jgi:hypothetical protein
LCDGSLIVRALFRPATVLEPIGNAGRNILRANGINPVEFGLIKSTRVTESNSLQLHVNFCNAFNSRDWGIPEGAFTSPAFLNEGATEVSARRSQVGCDTYSRVVSGLKVGERRT